jgi:lipoyl(octanoyl) transferase
MPKVVNMAVASQGSLRAVDCAIEDLGRQPFAPVLVRMRQLHSAVHREAAPGCILMVEHDPVYTAGRATPPEQLADGIVPVERGGQVTYHGPGQLVVYPIVRLPRRDVRDWLRRLEAFGVAVCAELGLSAVASVDGTGVFVGGKKVASIGVAVQHWISLHGIAINVAMDLAPWHRVRPCGLPPTIMTDLSTAAGRPIALADARAAVRRQVFVLTAADVRL